MAGVPSAASVEKIVLGAAQSDSVMPETSPGLTELVTPHGEDSAWLCTNLMRAVEDDALGWEAQSDS